MQTWANKSPNNFSILNGGKLKPAYFRRRAAIKPVRPRPANARVVGSGAGSGLRVKVPALLSDELGLEVVLKIVKPGVKPALKSY